MALSLVSLIKGLWLFSPENYSFSVFLNVYLFGVSLITMACTEVIRTCACEAGNTSGDGLDCAFYEQF